MIGLIDIGGTKLLASATDAEGRPGPHVLRATPRQGDPIACLAEMLDEVRAGSALDAIAMAVPGPMDRRAPGLINPPGMPRAWHGLNLAALGGRFGCPVVAENDANCAALAEAHFGAARGFDTVLYYTVSTGIGSGIVRHGELFISRHDTEGGHQVLWPKQVDGPPCDCGGHGCLEALASGRAIERRFGTRAEDLEDPAAWNEVGAWLGQAVVNGVALIDCDIVVFGGGVINQWQRFAPALRRTVAESLFLQPAPEIRTAQLGVDRNVWGALTLVRGGRGGSRAGGG